MVSLMGRLLHQTSDYLLTRAPPIITMQRTGHARPETGGLTDRSMQRYGGTTTTRDTIDGLPVFSNALNLNVHARLACLICGSTAGSGDLFWGCSACGVAAPLTLVYPPAIAHLGVAAAAQEARRAYAAFSPAANEIPSQLPTPLNPAETFGRGVYLKNEAFSLTGSHKDRYHTVAAPLARRLGCRGVVASSTGNHGVSAAAHAAASGLRAVVFCHSRAPLGLLRAIGAFGGIAAQLEPEAQRAALVSLVEAGWFPATSMDPVLSGAGNPFGAEGYKTSAYEIVEQLDAMPEAVFIPTAGGDTYYGMAKGFAEIASLSGVRMPVIFAIQPQGANSLSQSLTAGSQVTLEHPSSIALSLADPQTGRHTMAAVERWGGRALDVSEEAIRRAIADLGAIGIYTDPASAAALAGYRQAVESGEVRPDATAVLLLTSSGFKWPDAMAEVFPVRTAQSLDELHDLLSNG